MKWSHPQPVWVLLLCSVTLACQGADANPRFFQRAGWGPAVQCSRIKALDGLGTVADVSALSDSTFSVLLGDERKLLLIDAAFRQIGSKTFDKDGPRGVLHPASAVVTDTMIYIADDARSLIRRFRPGGDDAGSVRLPFIPRRLRMSGSHLIVTPLVAGGSPAQLAFEVAGDRTVALGGTIARYDDIGVNTLANMTSVVAFRDRVVVMHEMVVPFGYVLHPGPGARLSQRFAVPVPADVRGTLGHVPREPLTDRNVNQLAVVAFAATAAPGNTLYYVTRGGDGQRTAYHKLIVQLDSLLQPVSITPVNVNPHHMTWLPARSSLIVVDGESEWFECPVS